MIGWRPYLLTALAVLLLALVVVDVDTTLRNSSACASANALMADGFLSGARQQYTSLLTAHPTTSCAVTGLRTNTKEQCAHARALATLEPTEARSELMALVTGDPALPPSSCVLIGLSVLPASTASK
jgi:hypothetical protein